VLEAPFLVDPVRRDPHEWLHVRRSPYIDGERKLPGSLLQQRTHAGLFSVEHLHDPVLHRVRRWHRRVWSQHADHPAEPARLNHGKRHALGDKPLDQLLLERLFAVYDSLLARTGKPIERSGMRLLDMLPEVSRASVAANIASSAMDTLHLLVESIVGGLLEVVPNTAPLLGRRLARASDRSFGSLEGSLKVRANIEAGFRWMVRVLERHGQVFRIDQIRSILASS
jgi:hypothetical protein